MNKDVIIKLRKMGSHVNILYIEDDKGISEQFETLFRKVFKNLDVVNDGVKGLAKYNESLHDIVITDIEMPNMDGITLIKEIRKVNPEQLIVVTSAYNNSKYLQELIEHGVDKFILKPFDMSKLFRDIAKIVSIRYNKKRAELLKKQLKEKTQLNQLLLDKMLTPIVVIDAEKILYKNEKFNELFELQCKIESEKCRLSSIFKSERISKLSHNDFVEYLVSYPSEKQIHLKNRKVEHFKVVISPLDGTTSTLVSFINTESSSKEIEKLRCEVKLDDSTHLLTRTTFVKEFDEVLDSHVEYSVLCFGLKNTKEFIRNFGIGHLHDIYETLGKNLQQYFEEDILKNRLTLYYFDTNHFVILVHSQENEKIKTMLKEFGNKYSYTTKQANKYESMFLDFLSVELNKKASAEKNMAEIENQLYMLKGDN